MNRRKRGLAVQVCAIEVHTALALLGILLFIVALLPPSLNGAAKKPKTPGLSEIHRDLLVDIPDLSVVTPQQSCRNWRWWAAVESVLAREKVPLGQEFWVDRVDGAACFDHERPLTLEKIAGEITGDYVLEDGRRVTIAATVLDGRLATLDRLILSIRAGRTSLLVWQKKAYLVQGLLFDEYVYTGGRRRFEVKEIRLREPGSDETVTFKSGDDSPDEIEGLLLITVLEK